MTNSINDIKGDEYVRFGANVTKIRKQNGLSQKDISNLLKVPQSTYAGYESGTRKVPLSIIIKIAKILKTSPDVLIGITADSNHLTVKGFEKDLVISYRNADELDKAIVRRTLKLDSEKINVKNA
jgi:transcriptional regulator with XRE-family HTH domain